MTNTDRAAEHLDSLDRLYDYASGQKPTNAERAQALADATPPLLMPDPQIIRTVEELQALDPDTLLFGCDFSIINAGDFYGEDILPAVVVATAAQVRAARTALEEA